MPRWSKRMLVAATVLAAVPFAFGSCLTNALGGAFSRRPEELPGGLGAPARALVDGAFRDLDPKRVLDYHAHLAGLGTGGSGNWLNPKMRSWLHPVNRFKFAIYMSASAVEDLDRADEQFAERLVALARGMPGPGKLCLLGFDRRYRKDGTVDEAHTEFHVSNEWVLSQVAKHPDLFRPVVSVHPYRKDALEALERYAKQGARIVKWLPNAQGIDPADPLCDPFYDAMKRLGLVLLSHAGEEQAVDAEEDQKLGNPLKLRRPLDRGVRVIVAHCACLGTNEDLDSLGAPDVPSFDLFLRLMDEPKYRGLVFGEISAMTQFNRVGRPLETMLNREDLHPRLVNGSDYPLPAINALVRTGTVYRAGFITDEERDALNEIYDFNPLLYDLVLKRTVKAPGTGKRFAPSVFMANAGLD